MTDEPTTKPEVRTQTSPAKTESTDSGSSKAPSSSLTTGDPVRREFSDKRNEGSKHADAAKPGEKEHKDNRENKESHSRPGGQSNAGAGGSNVSSDDRSHADRSSSSNQSNHQSQQGKSNQSNQASQKPALPSMDKTGSDCSISSKQADIKPVRNEGGGKSL